MKTSKKSTGKFKIKINKTQLYFFKNSELVRMVSIFYVVVPFTLALVNFLI